MKKIDDTFGLSRVLEPAGAVPVTAWKIDNRREIGSNECRIAVKRIHIEWDSFQQFCNECAYDEEKIKARIMGIIMRRGKLHNPFTGGGGIFYGSIEEMGEHYAVGSNHCIGDRVLCNTTLTALPLCIDEILEIDYRYGELRVSGYGIIFETTPVTKVSGEEGLSYTMAIMDESGSPYNVHTLAQPGMRFLIIGRDLVSISIYVNTIKKAIGEDGYFTLILDKEYADSFSQGEIEHILKKYTNSFYFPDMTKSVDAVELIRAKEDLYDLTINCEDLQGAEMLAVMMTKNKGHIYFTSILNNFVNAILMAESMGKEIFTSALDQYSEGYEEFTMELIDSIKEDLDYINKIDTKNSPAKINGKKHNLIEHEKSIKTIDFIYASPVTDALVSEVLNIAGYDCNVIIQGETGTGKEMILNLLHKNSVRKSKPCIKINCATIQENLAESEFFGYEAGAFTGAQTSGKKGYFDAANGGILFLDEVGTLSMNMQSKLLRVIQEKQFYRVGGTNTVNINVRIICANNVSLRQLVKEGRFREDLYYRLNICTIKIPPLRERKEDIIALSKAFLGRYCEQYGEDKELDNSALKQLLEYDWPGNVRELENLIHKVVINVQNHIVTKEDIDGLLNESLYEDLFLDLKSRMRSGISLDFNQLIEKQEQQLILYALKRCGTTRRAAEFLNMTQSQLTRKKQKYGI